jgi:hypothetical protein
MLGDPALRNLARDMLTAALARISSELARKEASMPQTSQRKGPSGARPRQDSQPVPKSNTAAAVSDKTYGVVSVLYHALQGAETYGKYISDAEQADDSELVKFFEQCRQQESERAQRAKQLLLDRIELEDEDDEDDDEDDEDDDDEAGQEDEA